MPTDKQLEDVKGILFQIDERIKTVIDSQMHLTDRFDKFIISHTDLVQRVACLETLLSGSGKTVEEVEDNYHALKDRIHVIEVNHDAIEELEESVEELNERLDEIEDLIKVHSTQWDTWHGRFTWFGEVIFKCAWVLGMGWLLYKFGLGGVNFAP